MDSLKTGTDTLFLLLGAAMVLAMHAGFAFLELGTVRKKNQVNALVKILVDFSVSTIAYFFIGYTIAYGVQFYGSAETLAQHNGYALVRFFFLLTFAAAIPAIVSGELADYKAQRNPGGLVFPSERGTPLRNRNWRRDVFDTAVEALGLTITPHNLRDTAASLAIQEGASVVAVAPSRSRISGNDAKPLRGPVSDRLGRHRCPTQRRGAIDHRQSRCVI